MAYYHSLIQLLVILLALSFLLSSNAIPISRLSNLSNGSDQHIMVTKSMYQDEMTQEDTMDNEVIEGRMDFEKNDYGATTSNPVHTPRPPRTL